MPVDVLNLACFAHSLFALLALWTDHKRLAYVATTNLVTGLILLKSPKSCVVAIVACGWAACATISCYQHPQIMALQVVPAIGAWIAETDRRAMLKEIVAWSGATRCAFVQGAQQHARLLVRKQASDAMRQIAADSFSIADENIEAQRRTLNDAFFFILADMKNWPTVLCLCAAVNAFAAGMIWQATPKPLFIFCLFLGSISAASRIPNATVNDVELGAATAAPLTERCIRSYAWAASISFISFSLNPSFSTAYVSLLHFAGAITISLRNPSLMVPVSCLLQFLLFQ